MRAARLIKMVLLLQSRPSMTGAELARELEVSERTVTRDALALSEAGVPVYADRGRAGGYRLVGGYRTRLTGLGRSEAEALFLSGLPGALREMGLEDAASAARLKVSAALTPSLSDAPHSAAQRFHLDAPGWYQEPETPPLLAPLADAVWGDRRVTVAYENRGGARVERVLEPHGLVLKAGVWYLCARVGGDGPDPARTAAPTGSAAPTAAAPPTPVRTTEAAQPQGHAAGTTAAPSPGRAARASAPPPPESAAPAVPTAPALPTAPDASATPDAPFRVYRIDRFSAVEPTAAGPFGDDGLFDRDPDFDLPAFWDERADEFARSLLRSEVVVRLTEEGARRLPYATDRAAARQALAAAEPDALGLVTVALPVESSEVAYVQLLSLGPEAEVLAPAELRAAFARTAERMAERYGAPPPAAEDRD
ncbi:helix-turn-helix transcriptional regulator [Streptomyces sp. NPDC003691]